MKEKTDPVAVKPIRSATREIKIVATKENKIAKTNFTVTNCCLVQPSMIFWRWVLKLEIITKTILVINIFITYRWGITAIIWGQFVVIFAAYLIGTYYVWKLIGYSFWEQWKDVSVYFVLSLVMYLVVVFVSRFISNSTLALIAMVIAGAVVYIGGAWLMKLEEMQEIKKLVKRKSNLSTDA